MEVEAARSFQIGLNTLLRMRGQRGPEADETKALAIQFMVASAHRDIDAELGGQAQRRARCR